MATLKQQVQGGLLALLPGALHLAIGEDYDADADRLLIEVGRVTVVKPVDRRLELEFSVLAFLRQNLNVVAYRERWGSDPKAKTLTVSYVFYRTRDPNRTAWRQLLDLVRSDGTSSPTGGDAS